jgi:Arc/MetJ-type ribon-helix-helix transcriptional regulator
MISIRLSDEDYTRMKSRCGEFASVSDFMRDAIIRALSGTDGSTSYSTFDIHVTQLRMRLETLEQKVNELMASLDVPQSGHE